jgi:hypothetical protein
MKIGDLVEDREGDKAIVRADYEDGYVGIEWDCNPGEIARVHVDRLSNISDRVHEHDAESQMVARVLSLTSDALKLVAAGGYKQAAGALRHAAGQLDELS